MAKTAYTVFTGLVVVAALMAPTRAEDWDNFAPLEESEMEPRIFGNFSGVTPNAGFFLAAALIGLLLAITFGSSFLQPLSRNGQSGSYNQYNGYGYDQSQFTSRSGLGFEDVATKMLQLEDAFKKYEVHEEECRDYVACEAAQVSRLERNGPLVKQVHDILGYGKQFAKYELLQRLRKVYEDGFNRNTEHDACSTYRELCEQSRGGNK